MPPTPLVVEYRSEWPELFEEERVRLVEVFSGTGAAVEHVGSTAIPDLAAKPIIDIAVGLSDLREAEERTDALAVLGYEYVPEYEAEVPDRRYFRRPDVRPRTHHVHCVIHGGRRWTGYLAFRDALRDSPRLALEYARLKRTLAVRFEGDRAAYTEAKSPFITRVLADGPTTSARAVLGHGSAG